MIAGNASFRFVILNVAGTFAYEADLIISRAILLSSKIIKFVEISGVFEVILEIMNI